MHHWRNIYFSSIPDRNVKYVLSFSIVWDYRELSNKLFVGEQKVYNLSHEMREIFWENQGNVQWRRHFGKSWKCIKADLESLLTELIYTLIPNYHEKALVDLKGGVANLYIFECLIQLFIVYLIHLLEGIQSWISVYLFSFSFLYSWKNQTGYSRINHCTSQPTIPCSHI